MNFLSNLNNYGYSNPLEELISTEQKYVKELEKVVCGYMREFLDENSAIPQPEALKEYSKLVIFSNIAEIYDFHKNYFLKALQENQHSIPNLCRVFTQNEHHFHMYSKFSLNKSISEHLISTNINYFDKVKKKLGHKLSITDLMIAPVQRMTRYPLLLESFLKYVSKNGFAENVEPLRDTCNRLKGIVKEINEFTALNEIRNFDGLLSAQGNLILHGPLACDYNGKRSKLYVFLFSSAILFTEKQGPKRNCLQSTYNFRLRIPVNQLHLKDLTNSKFSLQLVDPNGPSCTVICHTFSKEEHQKWTRQIRQLLLTQIDLIHALVNPNTTDEREILL